MVSWSTALLERVEEHLRGHEPWRTRSGLLKTRPQASNTLHLAVFVQPFLQYVLDGRKSVESRFSMHRRPPFDCVQPGDLVLVKQSAGPIVAVAEISKVWYYELDTKAWEFIRSRFSDQLCVSDPIFWESKSQACYATIMQFCRVERLQPLQCGKRDRRGWVVLGSLGGEQLSLFCDTESRRRRGR